MNSVGLAGLSNFNRLYTIEAVPSYLVPGPGMTMAQEYCLLALYRRCGSRPVSFQIKGVLLAGPFAVLKNWLAQRGSLSPASKVFIKCQASSYTEKFKIYTMQLSVY